MKLIKKSTWAVILIIGLLSCQKTQQKEQTTQNTSNTARYQKQLDIVAEHDNPVLEVPYDGDIQKAGDYYSAKAIGTIAYQWGYSLLRMENVIRTYTHVRDPKRSTSYRAPLNQIGWARTLPTAADSDMPTANNDTYYMSAVVDLTEPYILKTPDTHDRYYVVNVFDMYQNLLDYIGRRMTGTKAGVYAFVPPGWKGTLPAGISKAYDVTTNKIWLWGRLGVLEGENTDPLHMLEDQFKLMSLSEYLGKPKKAPQELPAYPTFPKDDKLAFYKELAFAMSQNPIFEQDKALVGQFERIGLVPGKFDEAKLSEQQKQGLYDATLVGPLTIISSLKTSTQSVNGWSWAAKLDHFGYDYAFRSLVSGPYLGGQGEKEALYPLRYTDKDGNVLNGKNSYVIKFDKEPPVNAFWSLTMYNATNKLLVENSLNRYKLSSDSKALVKNDDGSFQILMQHDTPENTDNWLPAPDGPFYIILRMYQPSEEILSLEYKIPNVEKIK